MLNIVLNTVPHWAPKETHSLRILERYIGWHLTAVTIGHSHLDFYISVRNLGRLHLFWSHLHLCLGILSFITDRNKHREQHSHKTPLILLWCKALCGFRVKSAIQVNCVQLLKSFEADVRFGLMWRWLEIMNCPDRPANVRALRHLVLRGALSSVSPACPRLSPSSC